MNALAKVRQSAKAGDLDIRRERQHEALDPSSFARRIARSLRRTGLAPEALVQTALDAHPSVEAAKARIGVAEADARALKAGPHEFSVSGSYISRSVDREGRYNEYDATLSRGLRLPGKSRLDRKAGEFGISAAENRWEDAKHQAALLL